MFVSILSHNSDNLLFLLILISDTSKCYKLSDFFSWHIWFLCLISSNPLWFIGRPFDWIDYHELPCICFSIALSSDRTNQMTKTHNDLDAILQLLQEASLIQCQLDPMEQQHCFPCAIIFWTVGLSIGVYFMLNKAIFYEGRCKSKEERLSFAEIIMLSSCEIFCDIFSE